MARRSLRYGLLLLLAVGLTGCFGYAARPTPTPTPDVKQAGTVRITLTDGAQIDLKDAYVLGDSLIGTTRQAPSRRIAVPVAQLIAMESYGFRFLRTAGLSVLIYSGLAVVALIALLGMSG